MSSRTLKWIVTFFFVGSLLTGCNLFRSASTAVGVTEATGEATPLPADGTVQTPIPRQSEPTAAQETATVPVASTITLTWWTPAWFFPDGDEAGGRILQELVVGFEAAHPGIVIEPIAKLPYGKGGLLDFLATASRVAPDVLPDLVALDLAELPAAVRLGLVQPLGALLPPDLSDDLFPFAVQAGQIEGEWLALPFAIDVEHLVYDTNRIPEPPRTWADFLAAGLPWLFTVDDGDGGVGDAVWIQYLGAGASIQADGGEARLDREVLTRLLRFYESARGAGLLPPQTLSHSESDAVWSLFFSGEVAIIETQAQRYLAERSGLPASGYAQIPTEDGRTVTLGSGWCLAMTTDDQDRQGAAMQFMAWLLDPVRSGDWTKAAGRLPSRRAALDEWGTGDPYITFLREQLEAARYFHQGAEQDEMERALRQATLEILTGSASPEEVATHVADEETP